MKKNRSRSLAARSCQRLFLLACFLGLAGGACAQQPLNMDFEMKSARNTRLPWGWETGLPVADLETGLDSAVVHHGRYGLVMKGKESEAVPGMQSLVLYLEPFFLAGKTIKIEGWTRCENFKGSVTVNLEYDNDLPAGLSTAGSARSRVAGTQPWKKFSFSAKLPAVLSWIRLTIEHSGAGNVWIDDLAMWVDHKKMTELPVAIPFTPQQMDWLDCSSFSLKSVDAAKMGDTPVYDDLVRWKELAGDARIIALGEATHGSSEFFRMKHRVLEYAVREMGVRVFAIEDHQLIAEKVNRYVLGDTGNARASMYGMFGVWDNREVYNLVKWIRHYNDRHPDDKVEFTGFDMQAVKQPLDSLYAFLQRMDAGVYTAVSTLLDGLNKNWQTVYSATDSMKQAWSAAAQQAFAIVLGKKQEWLSAARTPKDSLSIEWGVQYARLVRQFARENIDPMALYRDEAMAENISWLLALRKPGTRILVWAHDVHISRGEHPQKELNYHSGISMGSWLAKQYGAQYKAFGLSTYTGAYRAFPGYTDYSKWISCPACPAPVGSLDQALHQVAQKRSVPALLLDLSQARQQHWLSAPLPVRFANHVCYEYAYWTRFAVPYQFDGIIFIDHTSPAQKISEE